MNSKVKRYGMDDFGSGMIAGGRGAFGYTDVIATLEAECERLRSERDAFRDSRNYLIEEISNHLSEIAELREALCDTARWIRMLPVQVQGAIRQLERIDAALAGGRGQEQKDADHEL